MKREVRIRADERIACCIVNLLLNVPSGLRFCSETAIPLMIANGWDVSETLLMVNYGGARVAKLVCHPAGELGAAQYQNATAMCAEHARPDNHGRSQARHGQFLRMEFANLALIACNSWLWVSSSSRSVATEKH